MFIMIELYIDSLTHTHRHYSYNSLYNGKEYTVPRAVWSITTLHVSLKTKNAMLIILSSISISVRLHHTHTHSILSATIYRANVMRIKDEICDDLMKLMC